MIKNNNNIDNERNNKEKSDFLENNNIKKEKDATIENNPKNINIVNESYLNNTNLNTNTKSKSLLLFIMSKANF